MYKPKSGSKCRCIESDSKSCGVCQSLWITLEITLESPRQNSCPWFKKLHGFNLSWIWKYHSDGEFYGLPRIHRTIWRDQCFKEGYRHYGWPYCFNFKGQNPLFAGFLCNEKLYLRNALCSHSTAHCASRCCLLQWKFISRTSKIIWSWAGMDIVAQVKELFLIQQTQMGFRMWIAIRFFIIVLKNN